MRLELSGRHRLQVLPVHGCPPTLLSEMVPSAGIEPATSAVSRQCSATELTGQDGGKGGIRTHGSPFEPRSDSSGVP